MAASACGDAKCARCATDAQVADNAKDGVDKDAGVDGPDGGPTDAPVDVVLIL